jgi:RNA polymerase sigma-70 factor, ECF subfamily
MSVEESLLRDAGDYELVNEARRGSRKAFQRIFEKNYPLIYTVVHGIARNTAEAEDISQEVCIKVFRALPEFRGDSSLSTWIYSIARNEALNAVSRRKLDCIPLEEHGNIGTDRGNPDKEYRSTMIRERLNHLIERLDERQRIALELRYMAEKSYEEIAEIMAIPVGTVKTHLFRAKASLKRMMEESCIESDKKGCVES